jgi:hypothetical protein
VRQLLPEVEGFLHYTSASSSRRIVLAKVPTMRRVNNWASLLFGL